MTEPDEIVEQYEARERNQKDFYGFIPKEFEPLEEIMEKE